MDTEVEDQGQGATTVTRSEIYHVTSYVNHVATPYHTGCLKKSATILSAASAGAAAGPGASRTAAGAAAAAAAPPPLPPLPAIDGQIEMNEFSVFFHFI